MAKKKEYVLIEKIVIAVFAVIMVGLNIYLFNAKPCEGIDQIYLSCRYNGSFGDWLGTILMDASAAAWLWMAFKPSYANSAGSNPGKYPFYGIAIGLILIYFL